MKKNGFTLVELLGVIAILALLATIATPAIIATSNKIKGNMYDAKIKLIKENAILYAEKMNLTSGTTITINKLCENGYVSPDEGLDSNDCLKNPKNNMSMGECTIKITKDSRYKTELTGKMGPIESEACK